MNNRNISRRKFLNITSKLLTAAVVAPQFLKGQNKQILQSPKNWPKDRPYWDMPAQDLSKTLSKQSSALEDVVNPFHQPNLIYDKLNCYGGGDYDGFGIGQGDIDAASAGTNDHRLDVNGDTIVNATDANMLQSYKDGNRGYLEGYWNFL